MILFKREHGPMILIGAKTQTRRLWKRPRAKMGSIHKAKFVMLKKEYFAQLFILKVWWERLGDISEEDARKEGYPSKKAYLDKFMEINGPTSLETWVVAVEWRLHHD